MKTTQEAEELIRTTAAACLEAADLTDAERERRSREIRGELHAAAEAKAGEARSEAIDVRSVQAAVTALGGIDGLRTAFLPAHPVRVPARRALVPALGVALVPALAGIVGFSLAVARSLGWQAPTGSVALAGAALAVAVSLLLMAALVHVLARRDLTRPQRASWIVALALTMGVGGAAYFGLGKKGSGRLAAWFVDRLRRSEAR